MRQTRILRDYDPQRGARMATLAYDYPAGYDVAEHAHGADQLIYGIRGVMEVVSGSNMWLVPPSFALWIPAETRHRIHMAGAVSMRTLYFRRGLVRMPRGSPVLHVTPLLRELILEAIRMEKVPAPVPRQRALRDLLIFHLESATSVPTFIALPRDGRALAVAREILAAPADSRPLAALCRGAGVSVRTVERLFLKEVGLDFGAWRRQARLTRAVELLAKGLPVKEVSFQIGYRQPSAFVESFKRCFGMTPRAWKASLEAG